MNGSLEELEERELLVRLDERTARTADDVAEIKATLKKDYVTRSEFNTVRIVVFGAVGAILLGFISALTAIVFMNTSP